MQAVCLYLAGCAVQRFVLGHELVQENLEGVDPHGDRRLPPVPLLLSHGLLQDVLKQSVEVFVADALPIIHLGRKMTITTSNNTMTQMFIEDCKCTYNTL